MLIVSQDKKIITENINIFIHKNDIQDIENSYAIENEDFILGRYKTEERAKEILQEIISAYRDYRTAECDGYTDILQKTAVYEMPEE